MSRFRGSRDLIDSPDDIRWMAVLLERYEAACERAAGRPGPIRAHLADISLDDPVVAEDLKDRLKKVEEDEISRPQSHTEEDVFHGSTEEIPYERGANAPRTRRPNK